MNFHKLAFIVAPTPTAEALARCLTETHLFTLTSPQEADVLIVLGGDGFMLHSLHTHQSLNKPVYGIHCGTVGFLMNAQMPTAGNLMSRLEEAKLTLLHPLKMRAENVHGTFVYHAINEVSLLRETFQAAKIKIFLNDVERLSSLTGDGLIVATPAGSTAYNLSAQGPILPLESPLITLTPLSPFRPRHWRGAILPDTTVVRLEILEADHRRVSATADDLTVSSVKQVTIQRDTSLSYQLLFDPNHNLEDRILQEQFTAL